jgi:hypothetical protein
VTRDAPRNSSPGSATLFIAIGTFVLVGVPLVYVIWDAVNQVLAGNLRAVRPGLVFPAAAGLAVVLFVFTRVLRRWSDRT